MYTVLGLHHRPERHGLDELLLLLACTAVEQCIEALGDGSLGASRLHLISEFHHKLTQGLQFGGVGTIVDTIRQCLGFLALGDNADALGHRAVGQQHKLLNKFVGIL